MIRTEAAFVGVDKYEIQITVTMTVAEWREVRDALSKGTYWPNGKFAEQIAEATRRLEDQVLVV